MDAVASAVASAGGAVLRAATAGIAAVRPTAKPLHPRGRVTAGTLRRFGGTAPTGAEWLDASGSTEVVVRESRALGLPAPWPDIFGLAIRIPADDGYGDVLFASTGLGTLTRFTLTPALAPSGRPMTTLLPYRSPTGPVMLSAAYRDDLTVRLAWAAPTGAWHPFAELSLHRDLTTPTDAPVSFDPVQNVPPGLQSYEWVRRLREPAYAAARRSRR